MTTFVIVGGGLAGAKAAETLRGEGFDGDIVLFGDETELPYERPALAKGYLLGKDERDSVFVHSADWYPEHHVDLRLGDPVTAIDRAARTVAFNGGTLSYDKLALTTGASARKISIPGADLGNVLYLRTLAESEALLDELWSYATRAEIGWRNEWQPGDVVLWDNRCTMHRRDAFDPNSRRIMYRTQIKSA